MRTREEVERLFGEGVGGSEASLLLSGGRPCAWRVDVASGPLPSMGGWPLRHQKIFRRAVDGRVVGHNVFRGSVEWGSFRILEEFSDVGGSWSSSLLFSYDVPGNGWLVRRLVDHVRATPDPDLFVGTYGCEGPSGYRLLGYFTLTRMDADE